MTRRRVLRWGLGSALLASAAAPSAAVVLVADGVAKCCVVVGRDQDFDEPATFNWAPKTPLLQWAAEDLAAYLGRMGGATVPVGNRPVDGLLPIYVGCAPEPVPRTAETPYGDAYGIDVSERRIVLHGESRRAVYYAAADFLHRLGVRWYAPGDLGECVPSRPVLDVPTGRVESAPDFITRRIWCRPPDELRWMYRNRLGEPCIPSGHSLHAFGAHLPGWRTAGESPLESRARHPEYYAVKDGKPSGFINLANADVARIFAEAAVRSLRDEARLKKGRPGGKRGVEAISLSPDDGFLEDERPEVVALNSPGREPILGMPSFSDAWFGFLSRVCEEMERLAPDLDFRVGSLAYMNYILPPKKAKPHPRILPVIAPISFNRYVSMGTPGAPTSELLEEIVRGWTAISPRVGMYLYNFNLADMAMPYTRRVHWTRDFPKLFSMGVRDMMIESHPNWHTMMPGNYVAARLLWDTKTDVAALLDEYYPNYYGPAAAAMRRHDTTLENAYEHTKVFAGGTWGMHRILTPAVMQQLDEALTEAEKLVKGRGVFEQRVDIMRFSLNFAKLWFAARDAIHRYDLGEAKKHSDAFLANYQAGYAKYPLFFGKNVSWSPNIERYYKLFHHRAFEDAGRIAREGRIVYQVPDELQTHLEPLEGGAKPSGRIPDPDKDPWKPMKTFSSTLDEQGLPFFRGVLWHRHEFELPADARAARTYRLWFGGVDSKVTVWLNGTHVGEQFAGSYKPLEFDITAALKPAEKNTLLLAVDNTFPNEVGVGGLVRPAVIYAPQGGAIGRTAGADEPAAAGGAEEGGAR